MKLTLKEGKSVDDLSISSFANKCEVISSSEIIFKDISVDDMMEIISLNQGKSVIDTFNVEYSNLESAYLNLLREKQGENNV